MRKLMARDILAAVLLFVAVFLFVIAWPDGVMLGIIAAVFATSAVIVVVHREPNKGST
jgi:hypothetical protein